MVSGYRISAARWYGEVKGIMHQRVVKSWIRFACACGVRETDRPVTASGNKSHDSWRHGSPKREGGSETSDRFNDGIPQTMRRSHHHPNVARCNHCLNHILIITLQSLTMTNDEMLPTPKIHQILLTSPSRFNWTTRGGRPSPKLLWEHYTLACHHTPNALARQVEARGTVAGLSWPKLQPIVTVFLPFFLVPCDVWMTSSE